MNTNFKSKVKKLYNLHNRYQNLLREVEDEYIELYGKEPDVTLGLIHFTQAGCDLDFDLLEKEATSKRRDI